MLVLLNWPPGDRSATALGIHHRRFGTAAAFLGGPGPMHTGMHNGILANVGFVGGLPLLRHMLRPGPKRVAKGASQ